MVPAQMLPAMRTKTQVEINCRPPCCWILAISTYVLHCVLVVLVQYNASQDLSPGKREISIASVFLVGWNFVVFLALRLGTQYLQAL